VDFAEHPDHAAIRDTVAAFVMLGPGDLEYDVRAARADVTPGRPGSS
jgi:hypothetical protein